MKVKSNIGGHEYSQSDVCRIVNQRQQKLYIKNGLFPLDIYVSLDENNNDIIVMIFDKKESYPLYQKWCRHELI